MGARAVEWGAVVSREFLSLLVDRLLGLAAACLGFAAEVSRRAAPMLRASKARFATLDPIGALITITDHLEFGIRAILRAVLRWSRTAIRHRGFGLSGGLAWRGLAAMAGIGMAAALAGGLSSGDSELRLASLTEQPASDTRPVRDVRREPRLLAMAGEDWVRIPRPIALFGLESPELDRQSPVYEARRSQDGMQREDVLTFGAFSEAKPHLLLRLVTDRGEDPLSQPFLITLMRDTAARGMSVLRSGAPTGIETKFGLVETSDATMSDGETSRACIGFRHRGGESHLAMSGWWCGGEKRPADRQQLICLIDRLDLLSAGEDQALRAVFARTELNRQGACSPPRLSASGRKASWLDADGRTPALKTAARR